MTVADAVWRPCEDGGGAGGDSTQLWQPVGDVTSTAASEWTNAALASQAAAEGTAEEATPPPFFMVRWLANPKLCLDLWVDKRKLLLYACSFKTNQYFHIDSKASQTHMQIDYSHRGS